MQGKLKFLKNYTAPSGKVKPARWVPPEKGQVLAKIIHELQPKSYFEAGTANGYSSLLAAVAMPADGVVHTFDPANRWKIWEDKKSFGDNWKKDIKKINYHHGPFNEKPGNLPKDDAEYAKPYWSGVTEYLPGNGPSVFFIDGDHSKTGVLKDWDSIKRFLKAGDTIIFDDIFGERKTLKAYLAILGNLPHTFVKYEVERLFMDCQVVGKNRMRPDCLGIIKLLRTEDIKMREKEKIKGVHYEEA